MAKAASPLCLLKDDHTPSLFTDRIQVSLSNGFKSQVDNLNIDPSIESFLEAFMAT